MKKRRFLKPVSWQLGLLVFLCLGIPLIGGSSEAAEQEKTTAQKTAELWFFR